MSTYEEIISLLQAEGMNVAANVVMDRLAERKKDGREDVVEKTPQDRSNGQ